MRRQSREHIRGSPLEVVVGLYISPVSTWHEPRRQETYLLDGCRVSDLLARDRGHLALNRLMQHLLLHRLGGRLAGIAAEEGAELVHGNRAYNGKLAGWGRCSGAGEGRWSWEVVRVAGMRTRTVSGCEVQRQLIYERTARTLAPPGGSRLQLTTPLTRHSSRRQVNVHAAHARTTVRPPGFHPRLIPPDARDRVVGHCPPPGRCAPPATRHAQPCVQRQPRCTLVCQCSNLAGARSHPPTSACRRLRRPAQSTGRRPTYRCRALKANVGRGGAGSDDTGGACCDSGWLGPPSMRDTLGQAPGGRVPSGWRWRGALLSAPVAPPQVDPAGGGGGSNRHPSADGRQGCRNDASSSWAPIALARGDARHEKNPRSTSWLDARSRLAHVSQLPLDTIVAQATTRTSTQNWVHD